MHIFSFMVVRSRDDARDDTIIAGGNRLQAPEVLRVAFSPLLGALARAGIELCSLVAGVTLAIAAIAASAQPPDRNTNVVPPPTSAEQSVSKSDEHRIVGKVLELDREAGRVKLATEEGVVTLEVPEPAVQTFRVGDTVSVSGQSIKFPSGSPYRTHRRGSDRGSGSSHHPSGTRTGLLAARS